MVPHSGTFEKLWDQVPEWPRKTTQIHENYSKFSTRVFGAIL